MPPAVPAPSARPPTAAAAPSTPAWMSIPSIHVSSAPTRWKVLEELRELLGSLDEQVVAQWQTHTLLQRRDAELEYATRPHEQRQDEQQAACDEKDIAQQRSVDGLDGDIEGPAVEERESERTNGHNGVDGQQTETDRKEKKRKKRQRDEQSTGQQQPAAAESIEQQQPNQLKNTKTVHHNGPIETSQQEVETDRLADNGAPLTEIDIDDHSPATSPRLQSQPLLPAHGMQEIDINIDDDLDTSLSPTAPLPSRPLPPPQPLQQRLPQPPPPLSSRLSLMSVLTFLLPSRDPASYASWSIDTLVQRVQAEYTSQLHELCAATELSTDTLFSLAHLLSPLVLPTGAVRPVYVDSEVCRLIREMAAHVMAAIEGALQEADDDGGESSEEDDRSPVPVDEARLALSEVARVSGMIGMDEATTTAIRRWLQSAAPAMKPSPAAPTRTPPTNGTYGGLQSVAPAMKPSPAAPTRTPPTNGTHKSAISSSAPSLPHTSTSPSSSTPSLSSSATSVPSSSVGPVSLTAAIAAAKPRYIVLDGANIGRWSGSGDPSTEVTVTTTTSRPSHLQHLPSIDSRTMSRLASWQLVAAVHAIEQQLNVPALICLPEQFIRRPERFAVQDSELLLLLQKQGKLHRLPTGADDDSQLIRMAETGNTWIVTNDNFRDHVYSGRVTKQWVDERVIKFYTIEYPRVGGSAVGAAVAVSTEDEARDRGEVCLVEPSALRRNMHAKEDMEREREREEAEAAATAAHHTNPHPLSGQWHDAQQQPHVSKTGYPSIMSFPLHPPQQQNRVSHPQYLPPSLPPGAVSFPPYGYPSPDMYLPYPPPSAGHPSYPSGSPYWPATPGSGPHGMPYSVPPQYQPPASMPHASVAATRSPSGAPPVYPPGALRPEHFRRLH